MSGASNREKHAENPMLRIEAAIAEFGWSVVMTRDRDGFAYTVGLTETRLQAELCLHGVTDNTLAIPLLDQLAARIMAGALPPLSTRIGGMLKGFDLVLLAADARACERAYYARVRYGLAISLVQCVLPDASNRFPWQYSVDRWQTFGQIVMAPWPKDETPDELLPTLMQLLAR
ncbi:MAG: hypothetical protein JWM77_2506 [Rhodospirillales bacterium]|nr:hypothetical protein [Rhodospirillales bacterium]